MENQFQNIDNENREIYKLIQEEFKKENLADEIKNMVANKIHSTNFAHIPNTSNFFNFLNNYYTYLIGLVVVVSAITFLYLDNKNINESQSKNIINTQTPTIIENKETIIDNNQQSNENSIINESIKEKEIASNTLIKRNNTDELENVNTDEIQHIQTIKLKDNFDDAYIINSFKNIFNNLNLKANFVSNNNYISCKSTQMNGQFDNSNVNYTIKLEYFKNNKNKIKATILFIENTGINNNSLNLNDFFYIQLKDEILKQFKL